MRPLCDYCALRTKTKLNSCPIVFSQASSASVFRKTVFCILNLVGMHNQIPVHPADIPQTVVITPLGLLELVDISFEL